MLGSKISEASLKVVTPSGGLKKRITMAFPRSVNLGTETVDRACLGQR